MSNFRHITLNFIPPEGASLITPHGPGNTNETPFRYSYTDQDGVSHTVEHNWPDGDRSGG